MVEDFLLANVVTPDGAEINEGLARFMMIGVYVGCRMACADMPAAHTVAHFGNGREERTYVQLRQALLRVYGGPLITQMLHYANMNGFSNPMFGVQIDDGIPDVRLPAQLTEDDAQNAVA